MYVYTNITQNLLNMDKFIITTTPTIEGHPIKAYLGVINVNVVIGTNFFSDFAASFTDGVIW